VEHATVEWLKIQLSKNIPLNATQYTKKKRFNKKNVQCFFWITSFHQISHNIVFGKISEESTSVLLVLRKISWSTYVQIWVKIKQIVTFVMLMKRIVFFVIYRLKHYVLKGKLAMEINDLKRDLRFLWPLI